MNNTKWRILIWIIVAALAIVSLFCIVSLFHNVSENDRLYFSIQGYSVDNNECLTIGRNSNVSYSGLPHDYMKVRKLPDGSYSWEIDEKNNDSLFYYKVGNKNPNLIALAAGDCINVDGKTVGYDIVDDIFNRCVEPKYLGANQQSVRYIMARNVIAKELNDTSYLSRKDIRSFFWRDSPDAQLKFCVLDSKCKIHKADGNEIGYCYKGTVSADSCKIQFYTVSENSYMVADDGEYMFTINGLCYTAKPVVMATEWGAGHIKVESSAGEKGMSVYFPKAITLIERIDKFTEDARNTSTKTKVVNIMQDYGAFPIANTIYLPVFSDLYSMDLCSINIAEDSISLKDNSGKSTLIESRSRLMPDFESIDVRSGDVRLKCKVGIIDGKFVRSFVHLPLMLLVWFVVFLIILLKRTKKIEHVYTQSKEKLLGNVYVTICVFLIAVVYCLCKTLIAIKLSYTYPYFEKIAGINVVSVSLFLTFAFALYSLFSQRFFRFVDDRESNNRGKRRMIPTNALAFIFMAVAFGCVVLLWHFGVDRGLNANMLKSYMSGDLFSYNVLDWTTLSGMNDTHRSVIYTLSAFIFVSMIAFLILQIKGIGKLLEKISSANKKGSVVAFIAIVTVALVGCNLLPGNFATAFITLIVVVGLSMVLSRLDYGKPLQTFVFLLVVTALFGFFSVLPDNGYVTNWGGILFAACWLVLLNSVRLSNDTNPKRRKSYVRLALGTFVFVILLVSGAVYYIMKKSDENKVNYDRMNRRFDLLLNYGDVKDKGFRYSESDVEFMVIMAHYMQNNNGDDPLSNEKHLLHKSISTGQSPVVLNDVSIQSSFFSAYGWKAKTMYFVLQIMLILLVCYYVLFSSMRKPSGGMVKVDYLIDAVNIRRMLAVFMWVGTSLYLYLSYCGYLPFTGRLNPGFGVDSVGEVLESALLVAFMMSEDLK